MKIGQARCPYCGTKHTTGGIDEHIKCCPKNPNKEQKAMNQETTMDEVLKKYRIEQDYNLDYYYKQIVSALTEWEAITSAPLKERIKELEVIVHDFDYMLKNTYQTRIAELEKEVERLKNQ